MASSLFGTTPATMNGTSNGIASRLSAAGQTLSMLKLMSNPQAGINDLINQNPEVKSLLQSGMNPQAAFYAMAKQKGVDPESILGPLRTMMK